MDCSLGDLSCMLDHTLTRLGFMLGCCDFKSHFRRIWKFCHNWPKKQHEMGLDMSNVSSSLYPFPSHFLLGDMVNANPENPTVLRNLHPSHYHHRLTHLGLVFRDSKLFSLLWVPGTHGPWSLSVWYKTKFGSQNLATKFGNHLCMATKIGSQC